MIKRLLLVLALTLGLNGCATALVVHACSHDSCPPQAIDRAMEADARIAGKVIEALTPDPVRAPWAHVTVEGVVTLGGAPLDQARVGLYRGSHLLGSIRTDRTGAYDLHDVVEPRRCNDLRVIFEHPDLGRTDAMPVGCGRRSLDHDFDTRKANATANRAG